MRCSVSLQSERAQLKQLITDWSAVRYPPHALHGSTTTQGRGWPVVVQPRFLRLTELALSLPPPPFPVAHALALCTVQDSFPERHCAVLARYMPVQSLISNAGT